MSMYVPVYVCMGVVYMCAYVCMCLWFVCVCAHKHVCIKLSLHYSQAPSCSVFEVALLTLVMSSPIG